MIWSLVGKQHLPRQLMCETAVFPSPIVAGGQAFMTSLLQLYSWIRKYYSLSKAPSQVTFALFCCTFSWFIIF